MFRKKSLNTTLNKIIPFKDVLAVGQQRQLVKPELTHDDLAFLQFTGGTTGLGERGNVIAWKFTCKRCSSRYFFWTNSR